MSEAVKTQKSSSEMFRLVITLFAISAICAMLLGMVNAITADPIQQAQKEKTQAAMQEVLAADTYSELDYAGSDATVVTVYQAGDAGYVVQVQPSGFGGVIDMMVGVDRAGSCTGVSIVEMSETAGLGANASKEEFRQQFVGQSGTVAVTKDGGTIDALTGATITSRAVSNGVTSALAAVAELG